MKQTTVRFSDETLRQILQLKGLFGSPTNSDVIRSAISLALTIEIARRTLSDSDFVGFLAEVYRPIAWAPQS